MNTLVNKTNLLEVVELLADRDTLIWDCETTGLRAYHESAAFSVAIADLEGNAWYFNFKAYAGLDNGYVLSPIDLEPIMLHARRWIAHNAKFDMHFTGKYGICPRGQIFDTEVIARLYQNDLQFKGGYSLAACAERWLSVRKDDRVKTWMDENGAYTMHPNAEGTRDFKNYYFELVPFELISEYACQDAIVTGQLFKFLTDGMYETTSFETESKLIPVLFEMERLGVKVDRGYCQHAYDIEKADIDRIEEALTKMCWAEFMDSSKFLAPILEARGFILPSTEKGNPQITDEVISQLPDDELGQLILKVREKSKRLGTYWSNYLFLSDKNDTLHPNFRQSGAVTGRMSCDNPNLQNVPTEDTSEFPIRRALIAREGFTLCSIDYKQMEFRLMLEYAQQMDLIDKIKAGLDPHDSTAELTGLTRKAAKTLNFGLLYGMGVARLAKAIGVDVHEAKQFKYRYFDALPGVQNFIRESSRRMESRGYTFNWAGRRYYLDDPKWSYKAANSIIQGGCAEICKLALIHLSEFLEIYKSRMVLQVHDEIVFEIADEERGFIIPKLKEIMEQAYEAKFMPMECSISVGLNFHDLEEVPC